MYPSDCPWITSVGGTDGTSNERAWSGSGGGFSNVFPQPEWQKAAVSTWIQNSAGSNQNFNYSGRGYPDIFAQATNFQVFINGGTQSACGTSVATSTFASIIRLIKSGLLSNGKPPLGFLNPWLYSKAGSALHDITSGSNGGCNGGNFLVVRGWELVTGLGTIDYEASLKVSQST